MTAGVWAAIPTGGRRAGARRARNLAGVWRCVEDRIDPIAQRPRLASDIEIKEFPLRGEPGYLLIGNPRLLRYFRLYPSDRVLLDLMDGTRTVEEIVVESVETTGEFELAATLELIADLERHGFLDTPWVDAYDSVRLSLAGRGWRARAGRAFRRLTLEWRTADAFVRRLHDVGLRWCFTTPALVLMGVVAVLGLAAFFDLVASDRFEFAEATALEGIVLILLSFGLTAIHELGHALYLVAKGRRVKSAGFFLYFGSPAMFIESSDGLMLERRERVLQSFAGPYAAAVVAGAVTLVAWAFPDAGVAPLLYQFAVLNYFATFMNLVPLLELDGYWILSELLDTPDLRPSSLAFVRYDLVRKLRHRERFSRTEVGLACYGILGVTFTIFSVVSAAFFWWHLFGGFVRTMWTGGVVTRLVLALVILVVAGPTLRAARALFAVAGRRAKGAVDDVRFRIERGWRVEGATLLDALPIVPDLPVDVLDDVAGRLRIRRLGRGEPVVRQGERARAFYIVRSGILDVVEERGPGDNRVLRTLQRGECFGELGLVDAAPRRATVRARTAAQVFELDKASFEAALRDHIRPETVRPTAQAMTELAALPPFAALEADELAQLVEHGEWLTVPSGTTLVRQGDRSDAFYAIQSGWVAVRRHGRHVRDIGPGGFFGELGLLAGGPRAATVRTTTAVRAFRLDRRGFNRLLRSAFRQGTLSTHVPLQRLWHH